MFRSSVRYACVFIRLMERSKRNRIFQRKSYHSTESLHRPRSSIASPALYPQADPAASASSELGGYSNSRVPCAGRRSNPLTCRQRQRDYSPQRRRRSSHEDEEQEDEDVCGRQTRGVARRFLKTNILGPWGFEQPSAFSRQESVLSELPSGFDRWGRPRSGREIHLQARMHVAAAFSC